MEISIIRQARCAEEAFKILKAASRVTGLSQDEILIRGQKKPNCWIRALCYYILRNKGYSIYAIGYVFGRPPQCVSAVLKRITSSGFSKEVTEMYLRIQGALREDARGMQTKT